MWTVGPLIGLVGDPFRTSVCYWAKLEVQHLFYRFMLVNPLEFSNMSLLLVGRSPVGWNGAVLEGS